MEAVFILALALLSSANPQTQPSETKTVSEVYQLYKKGLLQESEDALRKMTLDHPENMEAQMLLGETLFREQKFNDAIEPYTKIVNLEKSGVKLSRTQQRILSDQLAMAYGLTGRLNDAKHVLKQAINDDPEYPMNYYNLACVFAEESDRDNTMKNLVFAFKYKDHMLPGEQMPDPASDPSFTKYDNDVDFKALLAHGRQ